MRNFKVTFKAAGDNRVLGQFFGGMESFKQDIKDRMEVLPSQKKEWKYAYPAPEDAALIERLFAVMLFGGKKALLPHIVRAEEGVCVKNMACTDDNPGSYSLVLTIRPYNIGSLDVCYGISSADLIYVFPFPPADCFVAKRPSVVLLRHCRHGGIENDGVPVGSERGTNFYVRLKKLQRGQLFEECLDIRGYLEEVIRSYWKSSPLCYEAALA